MPTLMTHTRLLLGALIIAGCGPQIDLDDGDGSGEGTATSASTTSPSTTSPSTTSPSTTSTTDPSTTLDTVTSGVTLTDTSLDSSSDAGPIVCPQSERFQCTGSIDCNPMACGDVNSAFDEFGCLREACEDDEGCQPGEVCHTPQDWGGCASSGLFCEDGPEGQCSCGGTPDCGGRFCVPDELVPPALCSDFDDATACLESGCGPFVTGRTITNAGGGSCLCDLPAERCIYVIPDADVTPGPALYFDRFEGGVIKLANTYSPAPFGLTACADFDMPPAVCECAAALPCDL